MRPVNGLGLFLRLPQGLRSGLLPGIAVLTLQGKHIRLDPGRVVRDLALAMAFDQILFELPQFPGQRDMVNMWVDQSFDPGVEPLEIGRPFLPDLGEFRFWHHRFPFVEDFNV